MFRLKKLKSFTLTHEAIRMPKTISFSVETIQAKLFEKFDWANWVNCKSKSICEKSFLETSIQAMKIGNFSSRANHFAKKLSFLKQAIEAIKALNISSYFIKQIEWRYFQIFLLKKVTETIKLIIRPNQKTKLQVFISKLFKL